MNSVASLELILCYELKYNSNSLEDDVVVVFCHNGSGDEARLPQYEIANFQWGRWQ